jgi:integrase
MVFEDHKTATYQERKFKAEVEDVKRGLRRIRPVDRKFDELCDYWLTMRAPKKRSEKDDKSMIGKHLRPAFGRLSLRDIGIEDWDTYVNERDYLEEKTIDNHRALLAAMLNLATQFKVPWLLTVPRFPRMKIVIASTDYRWLRSEEAVARFLYAARNEGEAVDALYSTALYTGLRAGELAGLTWPAVSFERRMIDVVCSYAGPTKTNRVRHVPILDPLVPVLERWRRCCEGSSHVFTNRDGRMLQPSSRIFQEVLHRVLDDAGFPRRVVRGKDRSYICFHDLRHTFASHWVMNDGDIYRLQSILGHSTIKLTERYAHLSPDAFKRDYARLGTSIPTTSHPES